MFLLATGGALSMVRTGLTGTSPSAWMEVFLPGEAETGDLAAVLEALTLGARLCGKEEVEVLAASETVGAAYLKSRGLGVEETTNVSEQAVDRRS